MAGRLVACLWSLFLYETLLLLLYPFKTVEQYKWTPVMITYHLGDKFHHIIQLHQITEKKEILSFILMIETKKAASIKWFQYYLL